MWWSTVGDVIHDMPTTLEARAISLREWYLALRSAGFTEREAILLLAKVVGNDERS